MLRFVIGLVVIGAALAIAARVAMDGALKPATDEATSDRDLPRMRFERASPAARLKRAQGDMHTPWWVRARAMLLLSALLAVLGAFLALLVMLGGALVLTGLKNAVQ